MENSLLFINQNKDIIQEFLAAMEEKEGPMEIDTADSGLEAAFLLKKKKYKVVVTGLDLPTYDGTKIVEYLNQNYPQTVCIVYTWRLELANLKLLINERRVFRIFQRPMDYAQMYEAIIDGFIKYDKREADALDRRDLEQRLKEASVQAAELRQVVKERPWEKGELIKFLQSLLKAFTHDMKSDMPVKEKQQLVRYEKKLLFWLLDRKENFLNSPEELREDIYSCFLRPEHRQIVEIDMNNLPEVMEPYFCANLHFVIWLLLTRFTMMSSEYDARVAIIPVNQNRFRVRVEGIFPEGMWGIAHEEKAAQMITSVTQTILECFLDRFTQSIGDEKVIYYMEMQS